MLHESDFMRGKNPTLNTGRMLQILTKVHYLKGHSRIRGDLTRTVIASNGTSGK
jgi:hypothetical protein